MCERVQNPSSPNYACDCHRFREEHDHHVVELAFEVLGEEDLDPEPSKAQMATYLIQVMRETIAALEKGDDPFDLCVTGIETDDCDACENIRSEDA